MRGLLIKAILCSSASMIVKLNLSFASVTIVLLSACGSGSDNNVVGECGFPAPMVAGTDVTNAFADAPAQCGMANYAWLRDPSLGEVIERDEPTEFTPEFLEAAALAANLPIQPRYSTVVERIAYKTQDRGVLIEATTLIAYPTDLEGDIPADTLLFLHGTSGMGDVCAPSATDDALALAGLFASLGHLVVMPDYIGLKSLGTASPELHPYLIGEATAIASLDAVRAAGNLIATQVPSMCVRPRVVSFGGSQGGHATLWVDRIAPYYAPELRLMGSVATVPPANLLEQAVNTLQGTVVPSTSNMVAFYTAASPWYRLGHRLDEVFQDSWATLLPDLFTTSCDADDFMQNITAPNDLFLQSFLDTVKAPNFADNSPWGCMLVENSLTSTSVNRITDDHDSYSVLYLLGGEDEIVNSVVERASFTNLCNQGMPMQLLECEGANHSDATIWGMPEILNFIDDRLAEKPVDANNLCKPDPATVCSGTPPP
jgi:hypothetical protein